LLPPVKAVQEALEAAELAVKADPHDASLWYTRGTMHFNLDQYAEAVADYEKAQRVDSSVRNPDAGLAATIAGNLRAARELMKQRGQPKDDAKARALNDRAFVLQQQGHFAKALSLFKQAAALSADKDLLGKSSN